MKISSSITRHIPWSIKHSIFSIRNKFIGTGTNPGPGSQPKMISIEPTSRCNLNCPFCLVGQQNNLKSTEHDLLPRGIGDMDWDLYEKIVKDAVDFGINKIQLHFQGEPLLYQRFVDMIIEAKKHGLYTQAITNELPLTERKADAILSAGLDSLRFSVDGAFQETYELNRVGKKLKRSIAIWL